MGAPAAIFQLRLPDGSLRLARGTAADGPAELLGPATSLDALVGAGRAAVLDAATGAPTGEPAPAGSVLAAPVGSQEIWAAGVTYMRSRAARMEESGDGGDCYARVYDAERPELFVKAMPGRVRASGEPIGIRADSDWNVPEPELALVVSPALEVVGYTIGNDVSSRDIEGENPLYLPQAKVYDGSCAVGPGIVPADLVEHPFEIELEIWRDSSKLFSDRTSTTQLRRSEEELCEHLGRCYTLPAGACLLTGTSLVPPGRTTLEPGDEVVVRISGLGELRNVVEPVPAAAPEVAA